MRDGKPLRKAGAVRLRSRTYCQLGSESSPKVADKLPKLWSAALRVARPSGE